jgi:hypothetical protein
MGMMPQEFPEYRDDEDHDTPDALDDPTGEH